MFAQLSSDVDALKDWRVRLDTLSAGLLGTFVTAQTQFQIDLEEALRVVGKVENTLLQFHVTPEQYVVAFETIRHPRSASYWMLGAPVFRSVVTKAERAGPPLFETGEHEPLKCLLIVADAHGETLLTDPQGNKIPKKYPRLLAAAEECKAVNTLIEKQRKVGVNVRVPEILGDKEPVRLLDLKRRLSQRWDIIHYVGHTEHVGNQGYFILPGEVAGSCFPVGVEELAPFLANSRFLYLSSCQSSSSGFIVRLAEHGVTCVLGFRVQVPDATATDYAERFYTEFFRTQSVEEAFTETRRHFHKEIPKSRIWACALLVVQK
jgi:hypothetical protein